MNHKDGSENQRQHSFNKAHILKTAGDVFCQRGFRKTTMEMIAGSVDKAKSSIYYYFSSKEDIYKKILEKETEEMNQELHRSVEQVEHPFDKLRAYINTRFKELRNLRNFQRAMRDQSLREYTFIQRIAGKQVSWELDTIKSILVGGVRTVEDCGAIVFGKPNQPHVFDAPALGHLPQV